jgi:hypothetical protein
LPLTREDGDAVDGNIIGRFNAFVITRRTLTINQFCNQMNIECDCFQALYEDFIYRARLPDIASLLALLRVRPKITACKAGS